MNWFLSKLSDKHILYLMSGFLGAGNLFWQAVLAFLEALGVSLIVGIAATILTKEALLEEEIGYLLLGLFIGFLARRTEKWLKQSI